MKSWDNLTVKYYMPVVVVGEKLVGVMWGNLERCTVLSIEACESSKRSRGISALMILWLETLVCSW